MIAGVGDRQSEKFSSRNRMLHQRLLDEWSAEIDDHVFRSHHTRSTKRCIMRHSLKSILLGLALADALGCRP